VRARPKISTADPTPFLRLRLPDDLVGLALAPPAAPRSPADELVEAQVARLVAALPTNDRPSPLRPSSIDVDALIVAAVRACAALACDADAFDASHRRADRVRYGLVPALRQLGLWELKRLVEDAALKAETPERFEKIATDFAAFREKHASFIVETCDLVASQLAEAGIAAHVSPAYFHTDGVSRRLKRLALQDELEDAGIAEFYDMVVVVPSVYDCYRALRVVHQCGTPVPRTLEDMIPEPRSNGHSGIVTHVSLGRPDGHAPALVVQVVIQTPLMRDVTRFGIVEARRYAPANEAERRDAPACVRALLNTVAQRQDTIEPAVPRTIQVLAEGGRERRPKAFDVPDGATVLDLAYHIHRNLGNEAVAAILNRRHVALGYPLERNARVEILREDGISARTEDDMQLVTTPRARRYLRQQLNRDSLTRGRRLLRGYVETNRRVLIEDTAEFDHAAGVVANRHRGRLGESSATALYRALGDESDAKLTVGRVGSELVNVLAEQRAESTPRPHSPVAEWMPTFATPQITPGKRLKICGRCHPTQAHEIVGVDLARRVTVHQRTCLYVRDRTTIGLHWMRVDRKVLGIIALFCEDRALLVHDVYHRISRRGSGLAEIHASTDDFARARVTVHVYSTSALALGDLLDDLRSIPAVRSVELLQTSLSPEDKARVVAGDWKRQRRDLERMVGPDAPVVVEGVHSTRPRRGPIVLPYNEQKPVFRHDLFFGRQAEVARLIEYTTGEVPAYVFLFGPRIVGKTSLAVQFSESLPPAECPHVVRVDLRTDRGSSSSDVLWKIAAKLRRLGGPGAQEREDPIKAINTMIASSEKPVLIILDEFAAVLESFRDKTLGDAFFAWIRETMDLDPREVVAAPTDAAAVVGRKLRLVCVAPPEGRELLQLPGALAQLQRLKMLPLWTLDPDAASEMITAPFAGAGVQFHRAAVRQVVQLTGGHPYYIIIFLHEIVDMLRARPTKIEITSKDVSRCANSVLGHPSCWAGAVQEPGGDPAHHAVLRAVAQLQATSNTLVDRSEIIRKAKLPGAEADTVLDRLVTYHLLERRLPAAREVSYGFAIPLVRSWVRRHSAGDSTRPMIGLAPPS
jgi:GTP pyrophosphokinase